MRTLLAAAMLLLGMAPALAGGGPAETVVLVNSQSADSRRVAAHYARKRAIPPQQVCEVRCTASLETSMDDFVRDVVDPLREFLRKNGLEDRCRFVVLTQGMPIVARTPGGAVSTTAALSLLHTPVCGQPQTRLPGLRHGSSETQPPTPAEPVEGPFVFVTALLSTTAEEAIALVDRSVAADATAPAGASFVFQDASGAAGVRNPHYDAARTKLKASGFATEHQPAGADAVKGRKRLMGYMSGGSYSALTAEGVKSCEYLPGAICDMLQSFGAVPGNFDADAARHAQFPVTHMVRAGITGVHGAVAEPYNVAFPDAELFAPYVLGWTLAETFHRRAPYVYWMNLTLGDPLCAPYADRPVPSLAQKGPWQGVVDAEVAAPGAVRIDVYDDAKLVGSVAGAKGTVPIDTRGWQPGKVRQLLVEATGPGAAEPRGWITVEASTKARGTSEAAPQPVHGRCAKLVVECAAKIRAGDAGVLRITAADAEGAALPDWNGRIEVRSAVPPVRWASLDAASSAVEVPLRFTRVARYSLRITAPDDARESAMDVEVVPGDFDHATTPLDSFPLGQEADMEVVVEDRFGNRLTDWEGAISLSVPLDRLATLPGPLAFTAKDRGRGVLRGILLTQPGPRRLVFKDAAGTVISNPAENVTVRKAALRTWLVGGPAPMKDLAAADPAARATGDGSVAGKLLLRRRSGGDAVSLPLGNAKSGEAALAVTWVEALEPTRARLLAAAPGRLRILLDGKPVFDGTVKSADPRGRREPVAELTLSQGLHRLSVVTESRSDPAMSLEIDDGKDQFPASLRVRSTTGSAPETFTVSGRIHGPGFAGLAGARVTAKGSDERERVATSGADGVWFVEGLPAGETLVRAARGTDVFGEPERRVTLADAHTVDVDFTVTGERQGR